VIGQIYVGFVNWALMTLTLILTMVFRSSDSLAAAFGIAVSLTMLLTTALMFIAMREVWRWTCRSANRGGAVHRRRRLIRCGKYGEVFSRVAGYRLSSPAFCFS
jgi:hypothetical protein